MSGSQAKVLVSDLLQRGVIDDADASRLQQQQGQGPWHVVLLSGLAAWFAALLLFGGTLFTIIEDSALAAGIAGITLLGVAIWLLRQPGIFVSQLGLALSLVGQGVLLLAVIQQNTLGLPGDQLPALAVALVAIVMLLVPSIALHRLSCALLAAGAGAVLIGDNALLPVYGVCMAVLAVWLWLRRSHWADGRRAPLWRALAGASTLAALVLPIMTHARWVGAVQEVAVFPGWVYPAGAGALLFITGMHLARAERSSLRMMLAAALLVLATLGGLAPGLLVACALWLAVFHACERLWSRIVGLGATLYLGDLYYSLHITLLEKSILLMVCGVLLLLLRWYLQRHGGATHEG